MLVHLQYQVSLPPLHGYRLFGAESISAAFLKTLILAFLHEYFAHLCSHSRKTKQLGTRTKRCCCHLWLTCISIKQEEEDIRILLISFNYYFYLNWLIFLCLIRKTHPFQYSLSLVLNWMHIWRRSLVVSTIHVEYMIQFYQYIGRTLSNFG